MGIICPFVAAERAITYSVSEVSTRYLFAVETEIIDSSAILHHLRERERFILISKTTHWTQSNANLLRPKEDFRRVSSVNWTEGFTSTNLKHINANKRQASVYNN